MPIPTTAPARRRIRTRLTCRPYSARPPRWTFPLTGLFRECGEPPVPLSVSSRVPPGTAHALIDADRERPTHQDPFPIARVRGCATRQAARSAPLLRRIAAQEMPREGTHRIPHCRRARRPRTRRPPRGPGVLTLVRRDRTLCGLHGLELPRRWPARHGHRELRPATLRNPARCPPDEQHHGGG